MEELMIHVMEAIVDLQPKVPSQKAMQSKKVLDAERPKGLRN